MANMQPPGGSITCQERMLPWIALQLLFKDPALG